MKSKITIYTVPDTKRVSAAEMKQQKLYYCWDKNRQDYATNLVYIRAGQELLVMQEGQEGFRSSPISTRTDSDTRAVERD